MRRTRKERILKEKREAATKALPRLARTGNVKTLRACLKRRADPNIADHEGNTPLACAVQGDHLDAVRLLLEAGATPNIANERGATPLSQAVSQGNEKIVQLLVKGGAQVSHGLLIDAAQRGNSKIVKQIVQAGADVNRCDGVRGTALGAAVDEQHEEAVRSLLELGAEPNVIRSDGTPLLVHAASVGHERIIRALLDAGANSKASNTRGETALTTAYRHKHFSVIVALEEAQSVFIRLGRRILTPLRWPFDSKFRVVRKTIRAQVFGANGYHNIHELVRRRLIRASADGQSIEQIHAKISSRVHMRLRIFIPHGTYFEASGAHQNMISRSEYHMELEPLETRVFDVPATCINAHRPIPGRNDHFGNIRQDRGDLAQFLEKADRLSSTAVQAGVWAITDKMTGEEIMAHLVDRLSNRRVIGQEDIVAARKLLNELGIHHRL